MDGVGGKKNLFIVGATNRPEILDEALLRPGRLDQLIYIPLPDRASRVAIMKALTRKTPVAPNVYLDFIADLTESFSGADLTEVAQTAAKAAVRESIEADAKQKAMMAEAGEEEAMEIEDLVPQITRRHFEEALSKARISVTQTDLAKYDDFRRKFDPMYAASRGAQSAVPEFNWPEREEQFKPAEDEEDFYA